MGVRVHRRIELLRGLHLNLSRSGASLSLKLARLGTLNLSARGLTWHGRTPVHGVTYSKRLHPPHKERATADAGPVVDAEYTVQDND